jgi:transcription elongation factor Elf1
MTTPQTKSETVKSCGKCDTAYDVSTWSALHLVGYHSYFADEKIELRNCPCGSTMGLDLLPVCS